MNNIEIEKSRHLSIGDGAEHAKREVSIWLDSYDDIFSDFDPRPYSERTLSDDFISELKKVCREDIFEVGQLRLLIPEKQHNEQFEHTITNRLHSYFKHSNTFLSGQIKRTRRQAVLITMAGMVLILAASYISVIQEQKIWLRILLVLFEPSGWFFTWTGLDNLFFASRRKRTELDFYSKIAKAKVVFAGF
jgi:hypothetical protein